VAARLNWPCVRVNLDSHISRIDLIGKDAIVIREGMQVTEFRDGILPWAYQHNVALCFDEYDAGRPDVMFVIQRVLESSGRLTLLDSFRCIRLVLWDETRQRLISFREMRRRRSTVDAGGG
jgi:cobaltochelatase CobS